MIVQVLVLLTSAHCLSWAQPPPPPPRLSNSFSSKLRMLSAGIEIQGEVFINHELNKELQIIELGSTTKSVGKVHILDIGATKKEYQYFETFAGFCIIPPVEVTLEPVWSWLVNATLKGTETFQGKTVNVWVLKNKHGRIVKEAGFLALDEDTPVYIVGGNTGPPLIFDDYKKHTPPASNFTIPETCTKLKSAHSPINMTNFLGKVQKKFVLT